MYLINYKRTFYVAGVILCAACGNGKKQQQQAAMMGHMKPTVVAMDVVPASYTVAEKFPACRPMKCEVGSEKYENHRAHAERLLLSHF